MTGQGRLSRMSTMIDRDGQLHEMHDERCPCGGWPCLRLKGRQGLREAMLDVLQPSVGGRRDLAEFVVNNLTVHRPDLLRRAAVTFATDVQVRPCPSRRRQHDGGCAWCKGSGVVLVAPLPWDEAETRERNG